MMEIVRNDGESYLSYADRVTQALNDGLIGYEDWCKAILGENIYSEENLRRCYQFFDKFLANLDKEEVKELNDKKRIDTLMQIKEDIIKERKKLQTVNAEAQDYYRTVGRNELFNEKIQEAIKNLPKIETKEYDVSVSTKKTGLLTLADQHYGSNFEVKGLFNEIVNQYSPKIFEERMWYLLNQMQKDIDKFGYDKLLIVSMGDCLEGILRMSSLQKLREPVIDSAIHFGEFMAKWLVEAYNRLQVPITFELISGNHDVVRSLTQKPEFPEETLAKVVHEFIRLRLENANGIYVAPYGDIYYTTLYNTNLLFAHGTDKDLVDLMYYYENLYNVEIDTLYAGHLHTKDLTTAGTGAVGNKEVIRVDSICGTDPYAKSIRKNSRAGSYFALYSENGVELNKTYYLN